MAWTVELTDDAERSLKKLSSPVKLRIHRYITERLETRFDPKRFAEPLQGTKSPLFRWRVGDYRLISTISKDTITIQIVHIGHRKDVYKSSRLHG